MDAAPDRLRVVLDDGAEILGAAIVDLHGRVAVLRGLAIESDERGKGHGRTLAIRLMRRLHAAGVKYVYALESKPGFLSALGFISVRCETLSDATFDLPGLTAARRFATVQVMAPTAAGLTSARDRVPKTLTELLGKKHGVRPPPRRPGR